MKLTHEEWRTAAIERYGANTREWRFRCPVCGHVAKVQDWLDLKAEKAIAFSCVGRWMPNTKSGFTPSGQKPPRPCDYAGGGLFRLNPVLVVHPTGEEMQAFDFADRPLVPARVEVGASR